MNAATEAPPQNVIDGVDVDAVARATRGCPGVEDLLGGSPGEVATYLPGRRVVGVRVGTRTVEVQVRAAWNTSAPQIGARIRKAVAPLAGGRDVDVIIADIGDPPDTGPTSALSEPDSGGQANAAAKQAAAASADTADRMKVAGMPAGKDRANPIPADPYKAEGSSKS